MCIHTYMYICIYIYIHTYIHTYLYMARLDRRAEERRDRAPCTARPRSVEDTGPVKTWLEKTCYYHYHYHCYHYDVYIYIYITYIHTCIIIIIIISIGITIINHTAGFPSEEDPQNTLYHRIHIVHV